MPPSVLPRVLSQHPKLRMRSFLSHLPRCSLASGACSHLHTVCTCVRAAQSSKPLRALGAVRRLGAGAVERSRVRAPEKHIVHDQDERGHGHAEEIGDRHRHFHPDLSWHVGVFGPQLPGVARPPLRVPVQLLRGHGDLPAGCLHLGTSAETLFTVLSSAGCCVFIWVRTADAPSFLRGSPVLRSQTAKQLQLGSRRLLWCLVRGTDALRDPLWTLRAHRANWTQGFLWHRLDGTAVKPSRSREEGLGLAFQNKTSCNYLTRSRPLLQNTWEFEFYSNFSMSMAVVLQPHLSL